MISGSSNCSAVISVIRTSGASRPGSSTGNVTRRKVVSGEAPEVPLASSSAGSMARSVAVSSRKTNGVEASAWHRIRPPMLKMSIGPDPSMPSAARITRLSHPAFGPIRKIQAMASTGVGTSSGKRMSENQISRPGRSVRSISHARLKRDREHDRDRAGDEHERVGQDAGIDDRIGEQRVDVLERPARAGLEGKEIGGAAKGGEQQHRQRHARSDRSPRRRRRRAPAWR